MSSRKVLLVALAVLLAVAVTATLTTAQGPTEPGVLSAGHGAEPAGQGVAGNVGFQFPVQGRLTSASGAPLNGTYAVTFRLYSAASGGSPVCSDTNSVSVANGLFSSEIWGSCPTHINGQQLYLGVEVEADGEMTPRQPIKAVPYALSLAPGAVISSSVDSTPILQIESWYSTGRGLRAYAMSQTGTNYGVVGASRSPAGYGGYFYNNEGGTGLRGESDTGAAVSATGSGIIRSTADISISVSPLKMLTKWESVGNIEFLSDGAYMEIRPLAAGTQFIHIPVDLPSVLFGAATKVNSLRVCYQCDQAGSFIDTTIASQGTDAGTISSIINDTTNRTSTSWQCYTVTDATPTEIQGSVWIQLSLNFAGTGAAHDIRIGNIALTLTEQ